MQSHHFRERERESNPYISIQNGVNDMCEDETT